MENRIYFPNSKGQKLCGILSSPTGDKKLPVIIMIHGFMSNKNSKKFLALQQIFDARQISSFRIDAYGHGESEGDFADITVTESVDDILQAIEFLKHEGYSKIGLIGSSFGGISSIMAASETHDLFILGLICPVSDWEEIWKKRKSQAELEEWQHVGFTYLTEKSGKRMKLNYTLFEDCKKNVAYKVAHTISVPTIIVHGDADGEVDIEQSKKTAKLIPNSTLVIIPGADHWFSDERDFIQVMKHVSEFVLQHSKE